MALPTLDEVIDKLRDLFDLEDAVDVDAPVADLPVDSLDLLEWLYWIEQQQGVEIEESELDIEPEISLRQLYERIVALIEREQAGRAAS